jgi:hypothetical protein
MRHSTLALVGAGALVALSAVAARADSYWEVEHARANARAGGPVSERDAELLERYGCLSGSKSAFCKELSQRDKRYERKARHRAAKRERRKP